MLTPEQLTAYYRRVHSIQGTYDPYEHWNVPALAFGQLPEDIRDTPDGLRELDAERDLSVALAKGVRP